MGVYVNDGGILREITELYANDAGTLRETLGGYVNDGGTLRQFFSSGVVTISGESIVGSSGSGPVTAQLLINTDGTLQKDENGVVTQIDSATDWIIPNSAASTSYQVRFINATATPTATLTTLTEDVWAPIDQQHTIGQQRTGAQGPGQSGFNFDLEIRLGTGAALDTGFYAITAEIT